MTTNTGRPHKLDIKLVEKLAVRHGSDPKAIWNTLKTEYKIDVGYLSVWRMMKNVHVKSVGIYNEWYENRKNRKDLVMAGRYFKKVGMIADVVNKAEDELDWDDLGEFVDAMVEKGWELPSFKHYKDAMIDFMKYKGVPLTDQIKDKLGFDKLGKRVLGMYQNEKISDELWSQMINATVERQKLEHAWILSVSLDTIGRPEAMFGIVRDNLKHVNDEYYLSKLEAKTGVASSILVTKRTFELGERVLESQPLYNPHKQEATDFREYFRGLYKEFNIMSPYADAHPIKVLNHWACHFWLRRLDYNFDMVCKIGNRWSDPKMVRTVYGDIPPETVRQIIKNNLALIAN